MTNDQRKAIAAHASATLVVVLTCSECDTEHEETFSEETFPANAKWDAADSVWDQGWEIKDGKLLCWECADNEERS